MNRLALTVPLGLRETQNSFVSRLAARNGCATANEFCRDMSLNWQEIINGERSELLRLAALTGVNGEHLTDNALTVAGPRKFRIGDEIVGIQAMRRTEIRLCPLCVQAERQGNLPFMVTQRLETTLGSVRICPQHNVALLTLPTEQIATDSFDVTMVARKHQALLEATDATPRRYRRGSFEVYLMERVVLRRHSSQETSDQWIDTLPAHVVMRASVVFGLRAVMGPFANLSGHTPATLEKAENAGFRILKRGREGVKAWLVANCFSFTRQRRLFARDLGPIYNWLTAARLPDDYEPIRTLVRSFIAKNYSVPNEYVLKGKTPHQSLIPVAEIKARGGVGKAFFRDALKVGLISDPPPGMEDLKRLNLYTPVQVQDARDAFEDIITPREAELCLGCPPSIVQGLMWGGYLKRVYVPEERRQWLSKREIELVLARIANLPVVPERRPYDCTLLSSVALSKQTSSEILTLALDDDFRGTARLKGPPALSAILIPTSELLRVCPQPHRSGVTQADAAKHLNAPLPAIQGLIDADYLEAIDEKHPITRNGMPTITRKSLHAFHAAHIFAGPAARDLGVAVQVLLGVATRLGLKRHIVGASGARFFSRDDLVAIRAELGV